MSRCGTFGLPAQAAWRPTLQRWLCPRSASTCHVDEDAPGTCEGWLPVVDFRSCHPHWAVLFSCPVLTSPLLKRWGIRPPLLVGGNLLQSSRLTLATKMWLENKKRVALWM